MKLRVLGAGLFIALSLACGGGGGGGGGGHSVGPHATSLAEYNAAENPGIPCPTYRVGDEVTVGDFTYRIDEVYLMEAEKELPWIKNSDERRTFGKDGMQALGLIYSIRNDTPVKKELDVWMRVHTTDGEQVWYQPYNLKLFMADHGIEEFPSELPPNTWVQKAGVLSVQGSAADGAAGWVHYTTEEYDPTDPRGRRKMDVLHEQAIIDFGTPMPHPHINPEKR